MHSLSKRPAAKLAEDLEVELGTVSHQYMEAARGKGDKGAYTFPEALARLPRLLYSLRQGPLLGECHQVSHQSCPCIYEVMAHKSFTLPINALRQSIDDVFCLRSIFLRTAVEDSIALMSPVLLSARGDFCSFRPVIAETLALWSDAIIVNDVYDRIFVWQGHKVAGIDSTEHEPLLEQIRLLTSQRYPTPTVLHCKEGSSMARFVISRLCPSHHDTPEEQLSSFPALNHLSLEERSALSQKFTRTDSPSFKTWLRRVTRKS